MDIEFALIGSTPFAACLAGMLAKAHGRSVCWARAFPHPLQPQRGFDISIAPIIRPDTWKLLRENIPQMVSFLADIGPTPVSERIDPLLVATGRPGTDILAHMRPLAGANGFPMERQATSGDFVSSYRLRDATRILRRPLANVLPDWLAANGVHTIPALENIKRTGGKYFLTNAGGEEISAKRVILADDASIVDLAEPEDLLQNFTMVSMSGILAEPVHRMKSSIIHDVGTGMIIYQREDGALDAVAPGNVAHLGQNVSKNLRNGEDIRLAGRASFSMLRTADGGPLFGRLRHSKMVAISGLGPTSLFQVPAIARLLAEEASEEEQAYFTERGLGKSGRKRHNIGEFVPVGETSASA